MAQTPAANPGGGRLSSGFLFFLWTRMLATAANQVLLVALAWQMYDLTASAWDLGLVGLLQFGATFALTIPSGHLADRFDRRRVMGAAIALQAAVAVLLAWSSAAHWVDRELILANCVLLGIVRALQTPAQQAIVPALVETGQLARAMALSSAVMKVAVVAGPALGGFIYALGPEWAYGMCVAILVAAFVCVSLIPHVPIIRSKEPASWKSMFAGFGFIFQKPVVLGAISLDLFAVVLGARPRSCRSTRKTSCTRALGIGAAARGTRGRRARPRRLDRALPDRAAGRQEALRGGRDLRARDPRLRFLESFALSLVALGVSGAADMVSVVVRQTLVQVETPDAMRGRVSAVNAVFISTSNQLGEFRAGRHRGLAWNRGLGRVRGGRDADRGGGVDAAVSGLAPARSPYLAPSGSRRRGGSLRR
jgi:hypothetical protein